MKRILSLFIALLFAVSAFAGVIRITFNTNDNRNIRVDIDGVTYYSRDYVNASSNQLVLPNVQAGDHTVMVYGIRNNGKLKRLYESTFYLENNQEIHLTVNNNGSITREESFSYSAYGAMSDASFNEIYRRVRNEWLQSNKFETASDVFNTSDYYFTTGQARQIIELMNNEEDRLRLAKISYDNVVDRENFYQIYSLFNLQASRNELDNYVRYYNNQNLGRIAMSDIAFNRIYQDIFNQRSQASKMAGALNAFSIRGNYFTTLQARQIIALIHSEESRVTLAKASFDNIVDPANFRQMYDIFYQQANRDELNEFIRSEGLIDEEDENVRIAMSDVLFNDLYDNIESIWWPGGEMNAARDVFNSENNYFTTAQAKEIIELVSWESNRVELAKLSFDNIVDPQNFRQIYDLFSSESSKDELDSYIRTVHGYMY